MSASGALDPLIGPGLEATDAWLRYRRRGQWALAGVSVAVPFGSLTALVGPNGAGKTTLMRAWLGFERPAKGRVRISGLDPLVERRAAVMACAYVAQDPAFYATLTCREHLLVAGADRTGFDPDYAANVLARAAVPLDAHARTLSGGQRIQLGLAIALGTHARVLLLDEPLANLDPLARRDVVVELGRYAQNENATVLVSSHLVGDLEGSFDGLVVMGNGRVIEAGPVGDIVRRYAVDGIDERAPGVPGERGRFISRDGRLARLVTREPSTDVTPDGQPSLEDIVLGLLAGAKADQR